MQVWFEKKQLKHTLNVRKKIEKVGVLVGCEVKEFLMEG